MPYPARVYQVMIASPGDVQREPQVAADIILEWSAANSRSTGIVLLPARWETHAAPLMGQRPQEVINRQVLEDSDLLLGIFWTRIGTPTGEAVSGTVEEIEKHIRAGKPVMLYFSNAPVVPSSVDQEQYKKLRAAEDDWRARGLLEEYDDIEDFRRKFTRQLSIVINKNEYFESSGTGSLTLEAEAPPSIRLSDDARALLLEAVKDKRGLITRFDANEGPIITANGKQFTELGNPRSGARWEAALQQLEHAGCVHPRGYKREVFELTHTGYTIADQIAE